MQINYLGVQATLDESTSHGKTVMRLPREHREGYLKDMAVLFLSGARVDMDVTCVDLKALELQRYQQDHKTMPDVGRPHGPYAGLERMTTEEFNGIADRDGNGRIEQPPQPEQRGEWPKWTTYDDPGNTVNVILWRGNRDGVVYAPRGSMWEAINTFSHCTKRDDYYEITPTQAAQWLRENGHAEVADGIDGGDVPAGMEGARVAAHGPTGNQRVMMEDAGWFRGKRLNERWCRSINWTINQVAELLSGHNYTELHGPEALAILQSLAASDAWKARK